MNCTGEAALFFFEELDGDRTGIVGFEELASLFGEVPDSAGGAADLFGVAFSGGGQLVGAEHDMKTLETKSMVLLRHHLKALRLPTVGGECEKVAHQAAADNADHLTYLLQLTELELLELEKRAADRRLKAARFPTLKTLDTFGLSCTLKAGSTTEPVSSTKSSSRNAKHAVECPDRILSLNARFLSRDLRWRRGR